MAYARMGADGSQVYIYLAREGFHCCMCSLPAYCWPAKSPYFKTAQEMLEHLWEHIAIGQHVPDYCLETFQDKQAKGEIASDI